MTVRELFNHFENYFSKISYRDYNSYQTEHLENEDFESLTDRFLRDHSEDSVTEWMYGHSDNSLYLVISGVIMTVEELFNHFNSWFDKISYHTSPATTGEFGVIEDDSYEKEENQGFLDRFGDHLVEYWEYLHCDNAIYLLIKKK